MKKNILVTALVWCIINAAKGQRLKENCNPCFIEQILEKSKKVGLGTFIYQPKILKKRIRFYGTINTSSLDTLCQLLFKGDTIIRYRVQQGTVILWKEKDTLTKVTGIVLDEFSEPLPRVSIKFKGSERGIITNESGIFEIRWKSDDTLAVSHVGYKSREITWRNSDTIVVQLERNVLIDLDPSIVSGYLDPNLKSKTSGVTSIKSGLNDRTNITDALKGRTPSLLLTLSSGLFGATNTPVFRGPISIGQLLGVHQRPTSDPLVIVDGVPWLQLFRPVNLLPSFMGDPSAAGISAKGMDALILINPADIESITVLKDADATAIYGARGANGVIVIRTKKAQNKEPQLRVTTQFGFGRAGRTLSLMNTPQYLQMRREALLNDGITPDQFTAPELYLWDSTQYINTKKLLLGNTAQYRDAQVSYSSAQGPIRFLVGTGFHNQTAVFPGNLFADRWTIHGDVAYSSKRNDFSARLSGFTGGVQNTVTVENIMQSLLLAPNAPILVSPNGSLNWSKNGLSFRNPLGALENKYRVSLHTALVYLNLKYSFNNKLSLESSFGFHGLLSSEESIVSKSSQNSANDSKGSYSSATNKFNTWTVEPHLNYKDKIGQVRLSLLLAASMLDQVNKKGIHTSTGYNSDQFLGNVDSAQAWSIDTNRVFYKYFSSFGRLQLDYKDKYFLSLTCRRDASSRFGSEKQYGNFWAIGSAWMFLKSDSTRKTMQWISWGKLRTSYGTTGNDQIGDYSFLNKYTPYSGNQSYQGVQAISPGLANPYIKWEINRKFEAAFEAGFFKDIFSTTLTYYRHRSTSLLISYLLPAQSGANSINTNADAVVQNDGFETELNVRLVNKNVFFDSKFVVTFPRNKLLRFPNIELSGYKKSLVAGRSLSVQQVFRYTGIDSATGTFQFDGNEKYIVGDLDPDLFGGFFQTFNYKNFGLETAWDFRKQHGPSYLSYLLQYQLPGTVNEPYFTNQPTDLVNRWPHLANRTGWQKVSATPGSEINNTLETLNNSDALWVNSSFIRLQKVKLTYNFSTSFCDHWKIKNLSVYAMGENLLTITSYKGADPELRDPFAAPLVKIFSAGFQITL